jgi:urease accessory protein
MAGLSHPMLGWDHVLAMVSIGILSAQLGGRANWTVPSTALTVLLAMVSVGTFTVYHGYAHGAEMPTVANPVLYALGFMTGTAFLHLSGVLVGAISQNYARGTALLRVAGAAIAGTGAWFLVGLAN